MMERSIFLLFVICLYFNVIPVYMFNLGSGGFLKTSRKHFSLLSSASDRVQRIRDISVTKQILNDLTTAEFALKVELKTVSTKIDYELLVTNINRSLELLGKRKASIDDGLLQRLMNIKNDLLSAWSQEKEAELASYSMNNTISDSDITFLSTSNPITQQSSIKSISKIVPTLTIDNNSNKSLSLRVFVREDGTVDWEEAIASGKEVAKYGTELWERLNGKEEKDGIPSMSELLGQAQASIPDTEEITRLKQQLSDAQSAYDEMICERNQALSEMRRARREGIEVSTTNIQALRRIDFRVQSLDKQVQLYQLNLDMERICFYLENELQASLAPARDQRLIVAEVALLDKQLGSLLAGMPKLDTVVSIGTGDDEDDVISLIDDDELSLIAASVEDLKGRLGLVPQSAVNWGSLGVVVTDGLAKIKEGLNFYGLGTRMLVSDIQYAWQLLLRAAQGYTLKAREVNSMRRTGKDLLTLIPFTIILIIPLSPVGHVLIFSFIQRYFPDFFPSCYTEKRQNLWQLYSEIARKSDDELLGPDEGEFTWPPWKSLDKLLKDAINLIRNSNVSINNNMKAE